MLETDYTIDTTGRFCPVPVIETAEFLKKMDPGKTLAVITDEPETAGDIQNWCIRSGNEFLGTEKIDDSIYIFLRKSVR
jgi:TusA-related sulfurtransferase